MHSQNDQLEPRDRNVEIALVKTARALFDFIKAEENFAEIGRLDVLLKAFERTANDYHNRTGSLHPDLALELGEWATFKSELLAPDHDERVKAGTSGVDRRFIDNYGNTPDTIILDLEHDLGICEPK